VLALLAALLSTQMTNITEVWIFLITLGSGLGSVQMARWLWWRVGAEEELAALVVSTILALWLVFDPSFTKAEGLWIVALGSLAVWVPMALFQGHRANVPDHSLDRFYAQARPPGFWGAVATRNPDVDVALGRELLLKLALGFVAVYGTLFGLGGALLRGPVWWLLALAGILATARLLGLIPKKVGLIPQNERTPGS